MKTKILTALLVLTFNVLHSQRTSEVLSNRGMYVTDSYNTIISKPNLWTNFFNYCKNNGFTYLNLYGVSGPGNTAPLKTDSGVVNRINPDKALILSNFIQNSKLYGIEEIGVPVASTKKSDATVQYDGQGYVTLAKIITTSVIEYNRTSTYKAKLTC